MADIVDLVQRLKAMLTGPEPGPDAPMLLAYLDEVAVRGPHGRERGLDRIEAAHAILAASPEERAAVVVSGFAIAAGRRAVGGMAAMETGEAVKELLTRLTRSPLPFTEDQFVLLLAGNPRSHIWWYHLPIGSIIGAVERHVAANGLSERLATALRRFEGLLRASNYSRTDKLADRVARVSAGGSAPGVAAWPLDAGPWSDDVRRFVEASDDPAAWLALVRHAQGAADKARPAAKWVTQASQLIDVIGTDAFAERLVAWLDDAKLGPHPTGSRWSDFMMFGTATTEPALSESQRDALKGLVWASAAVNDPRVPPAIGRFGLRCFRKIPGWGAQSTKLGNAALWALGALPDAAGVPHLSRLAGKVRYAQARRLVEAALDDAALRAGVDRAEIEEMCVPDFGLEDGVRREPMGDFQAELAVIDGEAVLRWIRADGKPQKSVPAELKERFAEDLKGLKAELKDLKVLVDGQAGRIERTWLERRTPWRAADWRERYVEHGLVGLLARKLLWTAGGATGLWRDGALRDLNGRAIPLTDDTPVSLWHPIDALPADVLAWRDALEAAGIVQPIKQAWREVYLLTPAEEETGTYSNRFAAHIIRQHQFMAIAQQRGWRYTLQGGWDSHNVPFRQVAGWRIEWWVEPAPHGGDEGFTGYRFLVTDQVRFRNLDEPGSSPLGDVPRRLFSELMRDVDLFVSVGSIGNDPNWADAGTEQAFTNAFDLFSFGELSETAKTRAQVLQRLLPRLKIRDVAHVDGKWLVVQGKRNTYRIHLGSSNIQMDGRGYLCIVPDRGVRGDRVQLPFEGDGILSLVLSKAFLLAADDQIADPSILRQIGR